MKVKAVLINLEHPSKVEFIENELVENEKIKIDGVSVVGSVAPWVYMHDILMDPDSRCFAGIVYPVISPERMAVWNICSQFTGPAVRYCISPQTAIRILEEGETLEEISKEWVGSKVEIGTFPEELRPYRQLMNQCLNGEVDRIELPEAIRKSSVEYFRNMAEMESVMEWPHGDTDRVEVTLFSKPVIEKLPDYFSSAFKILMARRFAEDVWYYREDDQKLFAVAINGVDQILRDYDLQLPDLKAA